MSRSYLKKRLETEGWNITDDHEQYYLIKVKIQSRWGRLDVPVDEYITNKIVRSMVDNMHSNRRKLFLERIVGNDLYIGRLRNRVTEEICSAFVLVALNDDLVVVSISPRNMISTDDLRTAVAALLNELSNGISKADLRKKTNIMMAFIESLFYSMITISPKVIQKESKHEYPSNYNSELYSFDASTDQDIAAKTTQSISFLFATCRQITSANNGYFSGKRSKLTSYGIVEVNVPEARGYGTFNRPRRIPFFDIAIEAERAGDHFIINSIQKRELDEWKGILNDRTEQDALVFVHGFNTKFTDAIYRAAQIFWDLQYEGVPILYSWPSNGRVIDYLYDQDSVDLATNSFSEVLSCLADSGIERVHILAHSMGNRLVINALEKNIRAASVSKIGEYIMAAPDVDRDAFLEKIPGFLGVVPCITLYASSVDRALQLSKGLRNSVQRAGDVLNGEPLILDGVDTIDVSAVGADIFGSGHGVFASSRSILNDISLLIGSRVRPPHKRLAELRRMPAGAVPPRWWRFAD